ncbi:MAG: hypothetical protein FRX48_07419 [Lasallia pustulata]|uniref:Uncharacterized protein n=1 Tax=Lasallia pustulata TaxID=136370 RepID=A0A5M8PID6_9LECA|nr:MAG: hypothetical protein FRX48_07419 [Lasallia pustulata]
MSKSVAYKHYQRALAQWPVDLLRPEVSFQSAMIRRIDKRFDQSTTRPQDNVLANGALATVPAAPRLDEKSELEQANVLYSFLENRYARKYPITERLTKPVSNPSYYEDLMTELQEAPRRSWFSSIVNKWRGFLRFS